MSINNLNTYLNIKDSHLRVVSGNVYAQAMNIGGINVETAHGLQSVSDTGNVTSNTIQFSNATTGFVTTANVEVGGELTVSSNLTVGGEMTVSSNLTVGGNVVADYLYGDGSNISGISSSNLQVVTDTGNVTSNTVQFSNPTTAFKATSNLELTSASKIIVESNVLMDFKTLGQIEFPGSTVEQEYPPRALTGYETLVEGHGVFCQSSFSTISYMSDSEYLAYPFSSVMTGLGYQSSYVHYILPPTGTSLLMMWYGSGNIGGTATGATYAGSIIDLNLFPGAVEVWMQKTVASSGGGVWQAIGYKNPADGTYSGTVDNGPFNKNEALTDYWESAASTYTSTSGGSPAVSTSGSERLASNAPYGSWVTLKLPYEICLKRYEFTGAGTKSPKEGQIWGSTDGTTWSHVHTFTGGVADVKNNETVSGNTNYYSEYAFITTKITGADTVVRIVEIRYFGTPGPTTLDKGSLTLGRSLDVPRVSRYDVDTETPRPEKLILNLDTTVNSTPTDISGNGYHGKFVGGASYSAGDKAFVADGVSQYVLVGPSTGLDSIRGDKSHTISLWVKFDTIDQGLTWIFHGGRSAHSSQGTKIYINPGYGVDGFFFDSGYTSGWPGGPNYTSAITSGDTTLVINKWYHVTAVYDSVDSKGYMYVDGILKDSDTMADFNIYTGNGTSGYIDGQVQLGGTNHAQAPSTQGLNYSNIKLYSVALEASEVLKLYRLGRTGRSMVISDTAVGIGKVPEAQLDVRGVLKCDSLYSRNRVAFAAYVSGGASSSTGGYFPADSVWYNIGNGYDTSTYLFTAPVHGIYHMSWSAEVSSSAEGNTTLLMCKVNGATRHSRQGTVSGLGNQMSLDVELKAGDTCGFHGHNNAPMYYLGYQLYNRFCGHLLFAI